MKTQLMINGKLEDVEVENGNITILESYGNKTGWEKVKDGRNYYTVSPIGVLEQTAQSSSMLTKMEYCDANYFSNEDLARQIYKAQTLFRKLLRWQAENDSRIEMLDCAQRKHYIYYDCLENALKVGILGTGIDVCGIYFSSEGKAQECVREFYDDLMWYFKAFKSRTDR